MKTNCNNCALKSKCPFSKASIELLKIMGVSPSNCPHKRPIRSEDDEDPIMNRIIKKISEADLKGRMNQDAWQDPDKYLEHSKEQLRLALELSGLIERLESEERVKRMMAPYISRSVSSIPYSLN